jgi:cytochrome c biogenesis protein CcdA
MSGWPTLALGLVLGMRHAMDPDHVVAVAALTARTRRTWSGAWLGAVWGFGHTLTLTGVGLAIILLNLTLPPRVGLAFEFMVAIALVVVGAFNVGRGPGAPPPAQRMATLRAFGVGLAHGLAGSAAVALLVLATVRGTALACGYLALFGAGTIAGMVLISSGFAAPLTRATHHWPRIGPWMRVATGALSLAFGVWMMVRVGLVDGLFLAHPHWTPR